MSRHGSHKAQHYIPSSYLAAWCDPETPSEMHPYVWTFDRSGGTGRRRAPQNLFKETDIYTILKPDGSRDLQIEYELSKLERGLKSLVLDYVARRRQLPQPRQTKLIAFIAAMHGRTPQAREIQRTLWKDMLDAGDQQPCGMAKDNGPALEQGQEDRLRQELLRIAVSSPMQFLVPGALADAMPMLSRMTMTIMCTEEPSFITSDSPVTWFDPTVAREKFLTHKSSLSDEGIEVTMPLSPRHMIVMHHPVTPHFAPARYVDVSPSTTSALNRRTALNAHKTLVSWRDGYDQQWQIVPQTQ